MGSQRGVDGPPLLRPHPFLCLPQKLHRSKGLDELEDCEKD